MNLQVVAQPSRATTIGIFPRLKKDLNNPLLIEMVVTDQEE